MPSDVFPPGPGGLCWQHFPAAASAGPLACVRSGPSNAVVCVGSHSGNVLALSSSSGHLLALWRSHSAAVADVDVRDCDVVAGSADSSNSSAPRGGVQSGHVSLASAGTEGVCCLHLLGSKLRLRGASVGRPLRAVSLNPDRFSLEAATGGVDCCVRVVRWSRITGSPSLVAYRVLPSEVYAMLWRPPALAKSASSPTIASAAPPAVATASTSAANCDSTLAVVTDDALLILGRRKSNRRLDGLRQPALFDGNGSDADSSVYSNRSPVRPSASTESLQSVASAATAELSVSGASEFDVLSELPRPEGSNARALRPPTLGHAPVQSGVAISWGDCAQVVANVWNASPVVTATVRPQSSVSGVECVGRATIALLCNPSSSGAVLRVYAVPSGELAEESAVGVANSARPGAMHLTSSQDCVYASTPVGLLVGKQAPPGERARWLAARSRYLEAVDEALVAEADDPGVANEIGEKCLGDLLQMHRCSDAAAVCNRLYRERGEASDWERWAFRFASGRCLHELAPVLPASKPQLRHEVYELALGSMVAHEHKHRELAEAVRTWPRGIFDPYPVAQEARKKLASMKEGPYLKQALADLYALSGRDERAVALQLELGDRSVVEYIREHGIVPAAAERVTDVVLLDPHQALDVLVQRRDEVPPNEVVRQLMERDERRHAFTYLNRLWENDPAAGSSLHGLQVELCAEVEPELMLPFLQSSIHVPLERALEACKQHGLLREQVYVLGRMGNSREAVRLLLHELGDVPQALELAEAKGEEDLWEELVSHCFGRPELLPDLLDKAGSRLSALRLVQRLPSDEVDVPRLRDRLRATLSAQRSQVMLWRSCTDILGADVVELELQRDAAARKALSRSQVTLS